MRPLVICRRKRKTPGAIRRVSFKKRSIGNEKEALENIKDAIQEYLKTVEDLSKDQKSRYVEVG